MCQFKDFFLFGDVLFFWSDLEFGLLYGVVIYYEILFGGVMLIINFGDNVVYEVNLLEYKKEREFFSWVLCN